MGVQTRENSVRSSIPPHTKVQEGVLLSKRHMSYFIQQFSELSMRKKCQLNFINIQANSKKPHITTKNQKQKAYGLQRESERDRRAPKKILFLKRYFLNEVKSNREFLLNFNKFKESLPLLNKNRSRLTKSANN